MEVMELVQCNLQIKVLTGHRAKGCQAAVTLTAFGNGDTTAGSKTDAFLRGEALCFGISPPLPLLLSSLPRYGRSGTAFGGNGGLFPERCASRVARHCFESVLAAAWCIFGRERSSLFGADMTNLLMGRRDEQLTNQTPMKQNV